MGVTVGWTQAALGVALCACMLWPQPGYIHPDEFFQSTEVVAGDILNVSHLRTWEFDPDTALRDIGMPYLLLAPGFLLLRWLLSSSLSRYVVESYAVLVIPRITLTLAGALNLRAVRKLCGAFGVEEGAAVWLWVTSYVTWTFLTRAFSNTSETLLFSAFLLLLLETSQRCRGGRPCKPTPSESRSTQQRSQPGREARLSPTLKLQTFLLGAVLCMGFFNRPTFGVFVFAPLMWWADQICEALRQRRAVVSLLCLASAGFLLTFVSMSLTNSFYYNPDFGHLLKDFLAALLRGDLDAAFRAGRGVVSGLRIPPWSFVRYNVLAANLAEHGLHPWYTHLLVHMPSLLGPLALLLYGQVLSMAVHWRQRHPTDVLHFMAMVPVLSLSFFPHQEARFLLPVLPLVVVCVAGHPLLTWRSVKVVVLLFNLLGLLAFGWLHQGGVVPALSALQGRLKRDAASSPPSSSGQHARHHVVSYATYMAPRHLLFSGPSSPEVRVHDMTGGQNHPASLRRRVEQLQAQCLRQAAPCRLWLLLPAPALPDLAALEGWDWEVVEDEGWGGGGFCPHLSVERPPVGVASLQSWGDARHLLSQLCLKIVSVVI